MIVPIIIGTTYVTRIFLIFVLNCVIMVRIGLKITLVLTPGGGKYSRTSLERPQGAQTICVSKFKGLREYSEVHT